MASYQILSGDDTEYEVPEYPSFADERELHRLLMRTDPSIAPANREQLRETHGWEEGEFEVDITGRIEYHIELAKVVLEDASHLSAEEQGDRLRPGAVQDAREDFIQGCNGRSGGPGGSLMQALQAMEKSLSGPNGATTEATSSPTTAGP